MVLLVEAVRVARTEPDAMRVMKGDVGRVKVFHHLEPLDHGFPSSTSVEGFVNTSTRHGEVEVRWVAWVDDDGVQLRSVWRPILLAAHPHPVPGVVMKPGQRLPGDASVFGAKHPLRRRSRVPSVRLVGVARCEPEGVVDDATLLALRRLGESRRPRCFFPSAAKVRRAKDGGTEMSRRRGRQKRLSIPRVEHQVVDDVTEKVRPVRPPRPASCIAMEQPRTLSRRDQDEPATPVWRHWGCPSRAWLAGLLDEPASEGCGSRCQLTSAGVLHQMMANKAGTSTPKRSACVDARRASDFSPTPSTGVQ